MYNQGIDPERALRIVACDPETIAYDTETNGLEHDNFIVGYVITNATDSLYIPVRHEGGGNIPNVDEFELALDDAFRTRSRRHYRTVGHHLGFDLRMSLKCGYGGKSTPITLGSPLEDTMINEALIDDTTLGYGLDDCCARHGVTAKKGDDLYAELARRFGGLPDRKQMKNFYRLEGDNPFVVDYATGDGISTLELWRSQQPLLDEPDPWDGSTLRRVWKLECDLLPHLARMYDRGLRVDMEYGERLMSTIIKGKIKEAEAMFEPGFNVRSPAQVEKLYLANGYTEDQFARTATGKASFTESWLDGNEIGEAILSVRRLEKSRDSFVTPLISTNNYGGRVHPTLHQSKSDEYGVAGARLSCSGPNLQAFTKRNKAIGKIIRPLIIPDDGMMLYEDDFRQQEPRFFTHFSGEPTLVDAYRAGTMDIHDVANGYFNIGRDNAKRLGLGMLTGMQPKALAGHMRWPISKAEEAHRLFMTDAFPEIGKFQRLARKVFKERGVVKSILKRRAYLSEPRFAYKGVSRIIQNSGGDHMKMGLLSACEYAESESFDGIEILLSIHDSTIFQADPNSKHPAEIKRLLEKVATDLELLVPIPVDEGVGRHWGETSYGSYEG